MTIAFTIQGNHKDKKGNAVPKLKMTGNQSWMPKAREYVQWKSHIRASLLEQVMKQVVMNRAEIISFLYADKAPFDTTAKDAHMELTIWWKDGHHGDPENIFGSIADALFKNDKNLNGSFTGIMSPTKDGRVEVVITQ